MNYLTVLTILLAPAYAVRFNLFGLPTNLLMVWVFFVWLAFTIYISLPKAWGEWPLGRERFVTLTWKSFFNYLQKSDRKILIPTGIFFLAGIISLFVRGITQAKLGQFIVLFLQPISLFFIFGFIINKRPKTKRFILYTLYLILAACGLCAILQYFTLLGLPPQYWGNSVEPKRAIAFFSHPNFYALFAAPLLALLIPYTFSLPLTGRGGEGRKNYIKIIAWLLGAVGLFLSMSRAGWLGLATAIGVYLLVAADKKIRKMIFGAAIIVAIIIIAVPNLRWRFILPFYGEKSAVSRISLWQTGWKAIKESPVLGMGLTGFAQNWNQLNTDPNIDSHNFPHNIFLNFWVETGLLGLISLIGLIGLFIYHGLRPNPPLLARGGDGGGVEPLLDDKIIKLSIALFLIALVTQGLIDNPYFKNDLAMVFWIALSLSLSPIHGEMFRAKPRDR